jgi:hypothetical protein
LFAVCRCFSRKLSAGAASFAAEILGFWMMVGRNNSKIARCFSLFFAVFANENSGREAGAIANIGFTDTLDKIHIVVTLS